VTTTTRSTAGPDRVTLAALFVLGALIVICGVYKAGER
jgi:hypothetical protein